MYRIIYCISVWIIFLFITLAPSCPNNKTPEFYFGYGQHYSSEGDYIQAVRFFTKAIEKKQDYFEAYIERASAYEKQDSFNLAVNDYTLLLSFQNMTVARKAELLYMRGEAYYKSLQDSLACKDWEDSCELNLFKSCTEHRKNCKK